MYGTRVGALSAFIVTLTDVGTVVWRRPESQVADKGSLRAVTQLSKPGL